MSYLSQPTSKIEYGVIKIGEFINVSADGVISVPEIVAGDGITINYSTDSITVSADGADLIAVHGTAVDYTVTANDEYLGVNSSTAVTITLPAGTDGRIYTIKDEYGQGAGKITIMPQSGETIDKQDDYEIRSPHQSVSLVFRNGGWWIT